MLAVVRMDCTLDNVEANLASIAHYSRAAPSSSTISSSLLRSAAGSRSFRHARFAARRVPKMINDTKSA